jgi:hypothetical protein
MPGLLLKWKSHRLPIGVVVDIVDSPSEYAVGDSSQGSILSGDGVAGVAITYGPDATLASWRSRRTSSPEAIGVKFGDETAATVCGQRARRQEGSIPSQPERHADIANGISASSQRPAEHEVALAFEVGSSKILAVWGVRASERERYRIDERHFFESIRCP